MLTKYASFEVAEVLDIKGARSKQHSAALDKISDFESFRTGDGYLYVRIRAISSRTNRNHDGWPSVELAGSPELFDRHHSGDGFTVEASDGNKEYGFATFIGKPIFVDHRNSDPKKARGVIVDAKLNVLNSREASGDSYWSSSDVDHEHLPPTEVELLLEVDANSFPRLAKAITTGDLDGFSMGCDVEYSKCSHCGHIASAPDEYCSHILMKGAHHDFKTADGKRVSRKSYENCYGIKFFEISAVFDPADETALAREVRSAVHKEADLFPSRAPDPVRPSDERVLDLAESYVLRGVDPQTAMDMAQRKVNTESSPPGHGEGGSIENFAPKRWDYAPSNSRGLPEGSPPPINPEAAPDGAFGEAAHDALNERWPHRPVMNNPLLSSTRTAENPLPQEMHVRAPEELDTLRDEQLCPICGNDMQGETCQVCGYVSPPKEFDNPDLEKAQEIRQKMKTEEEAQSTAPPTAQDPNANPQTGGPNESKPAPPIPTKGSSTVKVKSDMHNWTPKLHPKVAARINQVEQPVGSPRPPTNEPQGSVVISDQTAPVTAAMRTAQNLIDTAKGNHMNRTADGPSPAGGSDTTPHKRVNVTDVGGVDTASNEEASKTNETNDGKPNPGGFKQVDVTGIGGTGVEDVSADEEQSLQTADRSSDDAGFNKDKTTDDSGPTKTFDDRDGQHPGVGKPVTSEPFPASEDGVKKGRIAYEDGTLESLDQQGNPVAQGGSANKGTQPVDPIGTKDTDRVNVLERKTSPENNSGPTTTWTGTDGNGVTKQQPPVTQEDQEWGGVKVPDVKLHTTGKVSLNALRVARLEMELGLTPREDEWNRVAALDAADPEFVIARLETLSQVKTAGLAKLTQHRQAGVSRLPRAFGRNTAAPDGFQRIATGAESVERSSLSDEQLDAGLYLR